MNKISGNSSTTAGQPAAGQTTDTTGATGATGQQDYGDKGNDHKILITEIEAHWCRSCVH